MSCGFEGAKTFRSGQDEENLYASKRTLAEKTAATDLLQKSLNKARSEKAELGGKVKELEAKLGELEDIEEVEKAAA